MPDATPEVPTVVRAIRSIRLEERGELDRVIVKNWGSPYVVSRGSLHRVSELPCLLATDGDRWLGVAVYRHAAGACELVLLEAFERGHGTGTALLNAGMEQARAAGARRLWLVTTNDNVDALRFYQGRGLRLVRLWPDAVTQARKLLKPEIPLRGNHGIPIRDELELDCPLTGPSGGPRHEDAYGDGNGDDLRAITR
ncbi:MAG: GNAT family N-acetyltransferase [Candidatus Limnocylindrales bacterium]|jgi:GNAT superfamily N-acetyltransferase